MSSPDSTTPLEGSDSIIVEERKPKRSNRHHHHGPNTPKDQDFNFDDELDMQDDLKQIKSDIIRRNSSINSAHSPISVNKAPIMRLPPELLLLVFTQLSSKHDLVSLLTVCKYFADLIIELVWFRPNLQTTKTFNQIKKIMSIPPHQTYWNYRPYIRRLNLSFLTSAIDNDFLDLFRDCENLERLTLVNCTNISHIPISKVLSNCSKLQSVDMTGVKDIHDDIFFTLAQDCSRLQGLYAPGCSDVSQNAILQLIRSCPMLKRIKLSGNSNINDETVLELTKNCKSLVEIDLHGCPNVTDESLRYVFKNLQQLREFRISHNTNITDAMFDLLPPQACLDKLRILDFTGCNGLTDRGVEKFIQVAPRLRNVVLSKCLQISDASLRSLSQLGKSLHYIHLGHCSNITDFGVASMIRHCHRIQYIDLACCTQLTNTTLVELASLQRLRRIGLVKCANITDSGILELVQRRGPDDTLERIHLSYCTQLSVFPIYRLLKNCPRLTHLSLTGINCFLTNDITRFCRAPPPDFTPQQQSLFCVFSGQGVKNLRDYLNSLFDNPQSFLNQRMGDNMGGYPRLQFGLWGVNQHQLMNMHLNMDGEANGNGNERNEENNPGMINERLFFQLLQQRNQLLNDGNIPNDLQEQELARLQIQLIQHARNLMFRPDEAAIFARAREGENNLRDDEDAMLARIREGQHHFPPEDDEDNDQDIDEDEEMLE